jgi:RNAse (barnase) inhibitor barstar
LSRRAGKKALAGMTIDWRHLQDWKDFKTKSEPRVIKVITEKQRELHAKRTNNIYMLIHMLRIH